MVERRSPKPHVGGSSPSGCANMKLRFLFMAVLPMFTVTWFQATIPDAGKNSKTEKLKTETSAKMEKQDMNFSVQKSEMNFVTVNQNLEKVVLLNEENKIYLPTKLIQKFAKSAITKNKSFADKVPKRESKQIQNE